MSSASRKYLSLDHLSAPSPHSNFVLCLLSPNGSFLPFFAKLLSLFPSISGCISLAPLRLHCTSVLSVSPLLLFVSGMHCCTASCTFKVLSCSFFYFIFFFGGSPLQFHWTFFIGLVIGVSLALLSSLNTPVCLGSFSCRVVEGDGGGGVCTQRMMLVEALQETDSEWCFVWCHLSFPVCSEHSPLRTLLYFCLKINLGHENFFFFKYFRSFVPNWFISNLWEVIFQALKLTYMSFRVALCWGKLFPMLVTETVSLANPFERLTFRLCQLLNTN